MEDFLPQDSAWPQRSWYSRTWIAFLVGGVIGLLIARDDISLPDIPFRVQFQIVIGYFLAVAVHETGHLIGGLSVGFKTTTFAVWPLQISRQGESWRVGWMRSGRLAGFVGVDPGDARNFRRRMAVVVAAGPGASAIVGIAVGLYDSAGFVSFWSMLLASLSLVPMATNLAVNDGARLRMLWRGGAVVERIRKLMLIAASGQNGVPPRDLNPSLLEGLEFPEDGSADALLARIFRFNWLLDAGRAEEAGKMLASILLWPLPEQSRATWWLEAAWVEARYRNDPVAARRWCDAVPTRLRTGLNRCSAAKAQAAIAFLEQRWDDAGAAIQEALKSCHFSDLGIERATRDDLTRLQSDVAARRTG